MRFTPNGIEGIGRHCEGGYQGINGAVGYSVFSNDGTKYVRASSFTGFDVFSFDRCLGSFSLIESVDKNVIFDASSFPPFWYQGLISISPNGQYLYLAATDSSFRFDLNSNVIANSREFLHAIPMDSL